MKIELRCENCEALFIARSRPDQPDPRFCSVLCMRTSRKKKPSVCQHCGKSYVPKDRLRITFCSRECNYAAMRTVNPHPARPRRLGKGEQMESPQHDPCCDRDCGREDCETCGVYRICDCCMRAAYTISLEKGERDIVPLKRETDGCLVCRDCQTPGAADA